MEINWNDVSESQVKLALRSKSPGTAEVYTYQWDLFQKWLGDRELSDLTLARYLHELHEKGRAPSSLKTARSAIQFFAKHSGKPSPCGIMTDHVISLASKEGAERGRGSCTGLTKDDFQKIVKVCGKYTLPGLRDQALFSCMWDAALRGSEALALNIEDVEFVSHADKKSDGQLKIRRSKTDQTGKGAYGYLGPPTVKRLKKWIKAAGIIDGVLFRPVHGSHAINRRMCRRTVNRIVNLRAGRAGLSRITSHSFRKGMTQHLTKLARISHQID